MPLADHASRAERAEIFRRYRMSLLGIGVLSGYLGAAPAMVWASGVLFAAAFFVLIPLAIWIYTLVFAFSSLWFAHLSSGLGAAQIRAADTTGAACPSGGVGCAFPTSGAKTGRSPAATGVCRQMKQQFGLIIIGDEILSGKRADKHLSKAIEILGARGLPLAYAEYVGDDPDRITCTLQRAFASGDVVFSTGGIGATPDDHTRQCAARALGVGLELHPQAELLIRERMQEVAFEQGKPTKPVGPTIFTA